MQCSVATPATPRHAPAATTAHSTERGLYGPISTGECRPGVFCTRALRGCDAATGGAVTSPRCRPEARARGAGGLGSVGGARLGGGLRRGVVPPPGPARPARPALSTAAEAGPRRGVAASFPDSEFVQCITPTNHPPARRLCRPQRGAAAPFPSFPALSYICVCGQVSRRAPPPSPPAGRFFFSCSFLFLVLQEVSVWAVGEAVGGREPEASLGCALAGW